jgi:DNA invertase Pin-like site-specific DNA recombinase
MNTTPVDARTAVVYTRSANPASSASHDRQLQDITAYAEAHGYRIVNCFQDREVSGLRLPRPALTSLMRFAQDHHGSTCLVTDPSRLARSALTHATVLELLRVHGVTEVIFVHTANSTAAQAQDTPGTRLLHGILMTIAEFNDQQARSPRATAGSVTR